MGATCSKNTNQYVYASPSDTPTVKRTSVTDLQLRPATTPEAAGGELVDVLTDAALDNLENIIENTPSLEDFVEGGLKEAFNSIGELFDGIRLELRFTLPIEFAARVFVNYAAKNWWDGTDVGDIVKQITRSPMSKINEGINVIRGSKLQLAERKMSGILEQLNLLFRTKAGPAFEAQRSFIRSESLKLQDTADEAYELVGSVDEKILAVKMSCFATLVLAETDRDRPKESFRIMLGNGVQRIFDLDRVKRDIYDITGKRGRSTDITSKRNKRVRDALNVLIQAETFVAGLKLRPLIFDYIDPPFSVAQVIRGGVYGKDKVDLSDLMNDFNPKELSLLSAYFGGGGPAMDMEITMKPLSPADETAMQDMLLLDTMAQNVKKGILQNMLSLVKEGDANGDSSIDEMEQQVTMQRMKLLPGIEVDDNKLRDAIQGDSSVMNFVELVNESYNSIGQGSSNPGGDLMRFTSELETGDPADAPTKADISNSGHQNMLDRMQRVLEISRQNDIVTSVLQYVMHHGEGQALSEDDIDLLIEKLRKENHEVRVNWEYFKTALEHSDRSLEAIVSMLLMFTTNRKTPGSK